MRLIAYLRVSTEQQGESGLGLEGQEASVRAYAAMWGHEIVGVVQEIASGGKDDRPLLRGVRESLADGSADGVIVAKLDRLTRSLKLFAEMSDEARKQGWLVISSQDGFDMSTPAGEMMAGVLATFAQFERRMISSRTKEALAAKRARHGGKLVGNKPKVPAEIVEDIRSMRSEGYTYRYIAELLEDRGVPTAQGGKWCASTVRYIFRSN